MRDRWVEKEGRRVKLCDDDKTQSVNICTAQNLEGDYEQVFYFCGDFRVEPQDIEELATLGVVVEYLRNRLWRQVYSFAS